MTYSLDDQIRCVHREIAMRERVYPRRVETGRMAKADAKRELECMKAVLSTLMAARGLSLVGG